MGAIKENKDDTELLRKCREELDKIESGDISVSDVDTANMFARFADRLRRKVLSLRNEQVSGK
ncbi:MAG: hypothetical protein AAB683_01755 [Patescibacteria group bacterium]